jgi:hypothetical protein
MRLLASDPNDLTGPDEVDCLEHALSQTQDGFDSVVSRRDDDDAQTHPTEILLELEALIARDEHFELLRCSPKQFSVPRSRPPKALNRGDLVPAKLGRELPRNRLIQ